MSQILIGRGEEEVWLPARYGNRHGLVSGATGTGKTVSVMLLAEGFSRLGVPVFVTDVKGDVAGLALPGSPSEKLQARLAQIGMHGFFHEGNPVVFWDLAGRQGHPVRTTISDVGPALLGRMLGLSDIQYGVLEIVFRYADEQGLLLLDVADLRTLLTHVGQNRVAVSEAYGLVSGQSIGAIQRALLGLEREGGTAFFGEPALDLADLLRTDLGGRGIISVLTAGDLILTPRLYSGFLLWLLSELFETLPEVGDAAIPRAVFIFDEAHLLFSALAPALRQRVEQVVRLIRSKGIGMYFCSQYPDDIPGEILGQLGNRVQHALRAYTPRDQKAVRVAAETFPLNPGLDVARVISQLAVGEALVSTLQGGGVPMPVQRVLVCPPRCRLGTISPDERAAVMQRSPVGGKYDTPLDRESAHEILSRRALPPDEEKAGAAPQARDTAEGGGKLREMVWGTNRRQGMVETLGKQAARTIGSQIGRGILRGILGGILGGARRK